MIKIAIFWGIKIYVNIITDNETAVLHYVTLINQHTLYSCKIIASYRLRMNSLWAQMAPKQTIHIW